jgi:hypothetical protein
MKVAGPRHFLFCFAVRELGYIRCWATSSCVWLCGIGARLCRLLSHVILRLAVRSLSSVTHVPGPSHIVFGCTVIELG